MFRGDRSITTSGNTAYFFPDTVAEEKSPITDQRDVVAQGARPKQPSDIKFNLTYNKVPKEGNVSNESDFPDLGSNIKKSPTHRPIATKDPSTHQRETGPLFFTKS